MNRMKHDCNLEAKEKLNNKIANDTKKLTCNIDTNLFKKLKIYSCENDTNMTSIVTIALQKYLNNK